MVKSGLPTLLRNPQTPAQMYRHSLGQFPSYRDRLLPFPAFESGIATVEERSGFAVPQFSVSDEEVDAVACFDTTEDPPYKAVTRGLILALPLHTGW